MATKKNAPEGVVTAVALCAGSFDGVASIPAGAVVEGVPAEVAQAHAAWLDSATAAVEYATANGSPVLQYTE